MDLLIQASTRYSDWSNVTRVADGAKMSAQMVLGYMESAQRMLPEHRIRAVDEDGRLIDKL